MKILLKNKTVYDKVELERFQKFHNKINLKRYKRNIILTFLIFLFFLIVQLCNKNLIGAFGVIVFGGITVYTYFRQNPKRKNKYNKQQENKIFIFEFTDKYITVINNNDTKNKINKNIAYRKFYKVYETKYNYYLYLDREYSIVLNKEGFINATKQDIDKIIKEKFNKKYKNMMTK